MNKALSPEQLRKYFAPEKLGMEDTEKLDHLIGIIGQDRAVKALEFGLHMKNSGYNIYVAGPPGIGKMTSVEAFIEKMAKNKETPPDICYVNNFDDSYNPKVLQLPTGKGSELRNDMDNLISHVEKELPVSFESDEYTRKKEEITGELNKKRENISREISEEAREKGFTIQPSPIGIMIVPTKDGEPLKDEDYQDLSESEKEEMEKQHGELQDSIKSRRKEIRNLETEAEDRVKELDQQVALHIVGGFIDDLMEKFEEFDKVKKFLEDVQKDILENIDMFKSDSGQQQGQLPIPQLQQQQDKMQEMSLRKYRVNVVVDNCKAEGAPVIVEYNPTYNNMIGRIEKEMKMGALSTDFSMIRAGSILRANGGFLVLPIEDVLRSIYSYDGLKRTLRSGEIHIEELGERLGFMTVKSIRPEPVPVSVKVIVVGSPILFYLLQHYDEDFQELFKVKADFDVQMDLNEDNSRDFMSFISTFCDREKLRHLDKKAVAKVMEEAARMAGDQEKLSIKFGRLSDLLREADFWAAKDDASRVGGEHVKKALEEKIYRSNLLEKRIQEMIERETILIDTEGKAVGQVNGLSVMQLDGYMFGRPSRITATVSPGREGVLDIEREAKLGGPIHSKGVMILSGYLAEKYSNGKPLTLASKIVFEQSYQGVEGDSASSAELYAILSSLSELPLRQDIAVTGSVNQHGQVQAIGGVNQKIEGFFEVCKARGLTGDQGVIIPHSNIKNLMLRDEVVEAVENGKFNVWAVKSIDEGLEILTGSTAGEKMDGGLFPEDSVNAMVSARLETFEETMKQMRVPENGR